MLYTYTPSLTPHLSLRDSRLNGKITRTLLLDRPRSEPLVSPPPRGHRRSGSLANNLSTRDLSRRTVARGDKSVGLLTNSLKLVLHAAVVLGEIADLELVAAQNKGLRPAFGGTDGCIRIGDAGVGGDGILPCAADGEGGARVVVVKAVASFVLKERVSGYSSMKG